MKLIDAIRIKNRLLFHAKEIGTEPYITPQLPKIDGFKPVETTGLHIFNKLDKRLIAIEFAHHDPTYINMVFGKNDTLMTQDARLATLILDRLEIKKIDKCPKCGTDNIYHEDNDDIYCNECNEFVN